MPQELAFAGNPKMKNFQDVYLQTPNHLVPSLHITLHFNFTLNIPNTKTIQQLFLKHRTLFFLCETKAKAFRCNFILHSLSCPTTDPLISPRRTVARDTMEQFNINSGHLEILRRSRRAIQELE